MESDVTHSATLWKVYAWADARKKQLGYGAAALLVLALILGYILWQRGEKQAAASHALAAVQAGQLGSGTGIPNAPQAYLKVAGEYPQSDAAARAVLLAGSEYFVQGNYNESHDQFQKFVRENPQSPLLSQALLGVAASLDAQNKTNEAATAYQQLIERRPNDPVAPQARFALARIYEAQGKLDQARNLFEEITRGDPFGSLGSEAGIRLEELLAEHPELKPAPGISTNFSPVLNTSTNIGSAEVPTNGGTTPVAPPAK